MPRANLDPATKKAYWRWVQMRQRCSNPNCGDYPRYGGRGIAVCERWSSFDAFFSDMGLPDVGQTLEREDNAKGYSPDNCVWADRTTQNRNRRSVFLSPEIADAIRAERAQHGTPIRQIAIKFGVGHGNVSKIIRGLQWVMITLL